LLCATFFVVVVLFICLFWLVWVHR